MGRYGKCPGCGGWLPPDADACPHCGAATGPLAHVTAFFGGLVASLRGEKVATRARPTTLLPEGVTASDLLFGLNILLFVVGLAVGLRDSQFDAFGSAFSGSRRLLDLGANNGPLLAGGQYFRLVTATFLHIGILHLAFNMASLRYLAPAVEELYGAGWTLFAYLVTGVGGNLLSWWGKGLWFSNAGASGAIYGFIGIGIVQCHRGGWANRAYRNMLLGWAASGFVYGFVLGADNTAHLGGMLAGAAFAWVLPERTAMHGTGRRVGALAGVISAVVIVASWGLAMRAGGGR